jgi:hypothetical protein
MVSLGTRLWNEGRRGSAEFDVQYYLSYYPDLQQAFGSSYRAAAYHFARSGLKSEGVSEHIVVAGKS